MLRALTLAALVLLPLPVLAQDAPVIDSIPLVLGGMAPGAAAFLGPVVNGTITQTGPGTFSVTDATHTGIVTVTEGEHCVFDLSVTVDGSLMGTLRLNANEVTEVVYTPADPMGDAKVYGIELKGTPNVMSFVGPDGSVTSAPNNSQFATSLEVADMQAGVAKLQAACPPGAQ